MSDSGEIWGAAAAVFGVFGTIMVLRGEGYKTKIKEIGKQLDSLKKFASTVYFEYYVESDMVVLGPRSHGKTSIVTAITKQWMTVLDTRPTPIDFVMSRWDCPEYEDS